MSICTVPHHRGRIRVRGACTTLPYAYCAPEVCMRYQPRLIFLSYSAFLYRTLSLPMSFHLVSPVSQLTGLCFGSPSRRSNGCLGHPSIHEHMVLRGFMMTAIVANAADIRRPDTTIRRNPKDASRRAHFDTRNTTTVNLYPAKVPEPSSIALPSLAQNRCQARCAPNGATETHVEFLRPKIS
jgi:hypothetical protein